MVLVTGTRWGTLGTTGRFTISAEFGATLNKSKFVLSPIGPCPTGGSGGKNASLIILTVAGILPGASSTPSFSRRKALVLTLSVGACASVRAGCGGPTQVVLKIFSGSAS